MPRTLYFAYPSDVDLTAVTQFASAITQRISNWTGKDIKFAPPIPYHSIHDVKQKLQQQAELMNEQLKRIAENLEKGKEGNEKKP